jgi:hypothetical protein
MDWTQLHPLADEDGNVLNEHAILTDDVVETTTRYGMEAMGTTLTPDEARKLSSGVLPSGVSLEDGRRFHQFAWILRRCPMLPNPLDLYSLMLLSTCLLTLNNSDAPVHWRTHNGVEKSPAPHLVEKMTAVFLNWANRKELKEHPAQEAAETAFSLLILSPFEELSDWLAYFICVSVLLRHGYPPPLLTAPLAGKKETVFMALFHGLERALKPKEHYPRTASGRVRLLKIGTLAKKTGETTTTLRYWTKAGLLRVSKLTDAGYHMYHPHTAQTILHIQRLKRQRFTLTEIKKRLKAS